MDSFLTNREKVSCACKPQECSQANNATAQNAAPFDLLNQDRQVQHPEIADEKDKTAKIETVYENGTLRKIIVTCSCGKEMIFLCHYN